MICNITSPTNLLHPHLDNPIIMAPIPPSTRSLSISTSRLEVPSRLSRNASRPPFYSSSTASSSTSDLESSGALSPRNLYAQSFDRPQTSHSLPSKRFRKNMKELTGFGMTEEEFEALPVAVRRKYFSTLERLRFAQNSRSNALQDLPNQSHRRSSLADRRGVSVALIEPRRTTSSRRQRKVARQQSVTSDEASWFLTLPEKIKEQQFTRDEQVIIAARLRKSVILDAADEALYRATKRASCIAPLDLSRPATPPSEIDSPGPNIQEESTSNMAAAMYESFRWMDEEEDLDLKLVLDDYHANLDGVVIPTPSSIRRPSFRRQMSVSKMPFGRASLSAQPRSPKLESIASNHNRTRSRTMSLIQPRHVTKASIATIDPNAAHYQDPEARLKLRVYLASPQKFDEAIEFGFPSMDGIADGADKENVAPDSDLTDVPRMKRSPDLEKGHSFLTDDAMSLFDDDVSMADPESPLTPRDIGSRSQNRSVATAGSKGSKTSSDFSHLGIHKPTLVKQPEAYAHSMAGSREMTLRMTLTRPDLRADESLIYGWQRCKSPLSEESSTVFDEKDELRGPLGGSDGWSSIDKDSGVVKRFWNKVKSSQRKST